MKTDFTFKGMMVPVFTPFNNDAHHSVNYDAIDKYAQHLKTSGAHGVFVNSVTGEGMTMTVDERKKVAETWYQAGQKYGFKVFVNIGGCALAEMYQLAQHAEQYKFDAVMVMPDVYYKPRTEQDLLYYMKDVAKYMPTRPIFYYHIPMVTEVYNYINFYYFTQMLEKEVPTFAGYFFADDRVDQVSYLREKMPQYNYIIGTGASMMAYMAEGFEAFSMTAMNIYPQMINEFYGYMTQHKMNEAYNLKQKFCKTVYGMFGHEMYTDFLSTMKTTMDKTYPFKMGPVRKPFVSQRFFYY